MTGNPTPTELLTVGLELLAEADRTAAKHRREIAAEWAAIASAHFLAAIAAKLVEG